MEFEGIPLLEECQFKFEARALFVTQIPPPAAPTKSLQSSWWQVGERAKEVTRPESVVGRPV
jgi:hypothetical protein